MRYWWVNQNQTYAHEVAGGYLWSPKQNANGHVNPFYEFMREVAPGDIVFSFAGTYIKAIGIADSYAYEAPKPLEFGKAGAYWNLIGWRVDVTFNVLKNQIKPADHIATLNPYLPDRYSPLQANGRGLQGVYLTLLNDLFGELLIDLIGTEARIICQGWQASENINVLPNTIQAEWEEHQILELNNNIQITETEKSALVMSRRGQGLFRQRVGLIEQACRVTKVTQKEYLRASHSKPWRDSNNEERLNGENGLMLTPDVDFLFDRGFISFENNGTILVSPVAKIDILDKMGLGKHVLGGNVGSFAEGQKKFLEFHREKVFLLAKVHT
jgi:putative restriction endonuclease